MGIGRIFGKLAMWIVGFAASCLFVIAGMHGVAGLLVLAVSK